MSFKLTAAILRSYGGPRASLPVLLYLADRADAQGIAWPSVATIAAACRLTERQVKRHLSALADTGYLHLVGSRKGGRALSTHWMVVANHEAGVTLSADKGCHPLHGIEKERVTSEARNGDIQGTKGCHIAPERVTPMSPEAIKKLSGIDHEPIISRAPQALHVVTGPTDNELEATFAEFWLACPFKTDQRKARKQWFEWRPNADAVRFALDWAANPPPDERMKTTSTIIWGLAFRYRRSQQSDLPEGFGEFFDNYPNQGIEANALKSWRAWNPDAAAQAFIREQAEVERRNYRPRQATTFLQSTQSRYEQQRRAG